MWYYPVKSLSVSKGTFQIFNFEISLENIEFIVLLQTFYSVMTIFQLLSCLPSKWWKVFLSCSVNFGSLTQIFPKTLENVSLFFWLKIINKEKWTDLFDLFIGLWLISINCLLGCHKWSKFYIFARQIPIILNRNISLFCLV